MLFRMNQIRTSCLVTDFQKGLGLLKDFGFTYDILIFPKQLNAALETIQKTS